MKSARLLFAAILCFFTIKAFGHEYLDHKYACEITGDQRGLNTPKRLFDKLQFTISAVEIEQNWRDDLSSGHSLLNLKISNLMKLDDETSLISITKKECRKLKKSCVKTEAGFYKYVTKQVLRDLGYNPLVLGSIKLSENNLMNAYGHGRLFAKTYTVKFKELISNELERLIIELGGEISKSLPSGLNSKTIIAKDYGRTVHQIHFEPEVNDGESYHLILGCHPLASNWHQYDNYYLRVISDFN